MEIKKLDISTLNKPTLYEDIEFKIDGKTFKAKRSTRPMWRILNNLEKRIKDGDFTAYYEQIEVMTNAPPEDVDKLDIHQVQEIIEYIIAKTHGPTKGMDDKEKKSLPPGAIKPNESPESTTDSTEPKA
jgi:hypothetical protein